MNSRLSQLPKISTQQILISIFFLILSHPAHTQQFNNRACFDEVMKKGKTYLQQGKFFEALEAFDLADHCYDNLPGELETQILEWKSKTSDAISQMVERQRQLVINQEELLKKQDELLKQQKELVEQQKVATQQALSQSKSLKNVVAAMSTSYRNIQSIALEKAIAYSQNPERTQAIKDEMLQKAINHHIAPRNIFHTPFIPLNIFDGQMWAFNFLRYHPTHVVSPNGKYMVYRGIEEVIVYDLEKAIHIADFNVNSNVCLLKFSHNSQKLFIGSLIPEDKEDLTLTIYDIATKELENSLQLASVYSLELSADGKYLSVVEDEKLLKLFSYPSLTLEKEFSTEGTYNVSFSPDSLFFIYEDGSDLTIYRLDDLSTPDFFLIGDSESSVLNSLNPTLLKYSPGGNYIARVLNSKLSLYDAEFGLEIDIEVDSSVGYIHFSLDEKYLIYTLYDPNKSTSELIFYSLPKNKIVYRTTWNYQVDFIHLFPENQLLLSGYSKVCETLQLEEDSTGIQLTPVNKYYCDKNIVKTIIADDQSFVTFTEDFFAQHWDIDPYFFEERHPFDASIQKQQMSFDGRYLIQVQKDEKAVDVIDLKTSKSVKSLKFEHKVDQIQTCADENTALLKVQRRLYRVTLPDLTMVCEEELPVGASFTEAPFKAEGLITIFQPKAPNIRILQATDFSTVQEFTLSDFGYFKELTLGNHNRYVAVSGFNRQLDSAVFEIFSIEKQKSIHRQAFKKGNIQMTMAQDSSVIAVFIDSDLLLYDYVHQYSKRIEGNGKINNVLFLPGAERYLQVQSKTPIIDSVYTKNTYEFINRSLDIKTARILSSNQDNSLILLLGQQISDRFVNFCILYDVINNQQLVKWEIDSELKFLTSTNDLSKIAYYRDTEELLCSVDIQQLQGPYTVLPTVQHLYGIRTDVEDWFPNTDDPQIVEYFYNALSKDFEDFTKDLSPEEIEEFTELLNSLKPKTE